MSENQVENMYVEASPEPEQVRLPSPGQMLADQRQQRGLSQAEVADSLHLTVHYVNALETDRYEKLPSRIFIKGYYKAYAELLNADAQEVVRRFEARVSAQDESQEAQIQVIRKRKAADQNLRWLLLAAVLIVLGLGLAWWLAQEGDSGAALNGAAPGEAGLSPLAPPPVPPGPNQQGITLPPVEPVLPDEPVSSVRQRGFEAETSESGTDEGRPDASVSSENGEAPPTGNPAPGSESAVPGQNQDSTQSQNSVDTMEEGRPAPDRESPSANANEPVLLEP